MVTKEKWNKQTTVYGDRWDSNKRGMIFVNKEHGKKNPYKTEIHKKYFGGVSEKPYKSRRFKTKSKALKFAKSHMKKKM